MDWRGYPIVFPSVGIWISWVRYIEVFQKILNVVKLSDVSENRITELPANIGNMTNLTDLNISQNAIIELPYSIGNLKRLQMLKADHNSLLSVAAEIGNCSALQELYLTKNTISELPDSIGNLKNLQALNVDCNQLTHVPETVSYSRKRDGAQFLCSRWPNQNTNERACIIIPFFL